LKSELEGSSNKAASQEYLLAGEAHSKPNGTIPDMTPSKRVSDRRGGGMYRALYAWGRSPRLLFSEPPDKEVPRAPVAQTDRAGHL
jgi:hypothetical protein